MNINEILTFLLNKIGYIAPIIISKLEIRLKNFVDCIPGQTYPKYRKIVNEKKILILGLGTGGSYLLEVLIKLGFKNFILVDGDIVEEKI